LVRVDGEGKTVEARIAYGGMAAVPARARHAEEALVGHPWDQETVAGAAAALERDFTPITDLRGSAWYRATVARNLLLGFHVETSQERDPRHPDRPSGTVPSEVRS
ncbi:MAG: xanthine dehydrogenase small subunit, partial [Deltaproteobacteria bacterium]|nr:xanthine dehydrogenase small subunit [Deltaproteobacteria bacterium]